MAYHLAVEYGEQFALVVPVSGRLAVPAPDMSTPPIDLRVHAFHGRSDHVVPFAEGRVTASKLEEHGLDVTFTEFNGGHLDLFRGMNAEIIGVIAEGLRAAQL